MPESAAFVENAHEAVRSILAASTPIGRFLENAAGLTPAERLRLVEQAIVLLEGFYVHLPLKRAMHAVDPLQRLRLLRKRLAEVGGDARFHAEMTRIFTSVRDLHTNYLLPAPFNAVVAGLPFRVEACVEGGKRRYVVGGVATGFQHPTFQAGVELSHWNGAPIERAVEAAADRHAGSNLDARHARGIAGLTHRPLIVAAAPEEDWVIVGYQALDGSPQQLRFDWLVSGLPPEADAPDEGSAAFAIGSDLETQLIQRARRMLFAPQVKAAQDRIAASAEALVAVAGTESIMPDVFTARAVTTQHGTFGHIRIWTFSVQDADAFVAEFVRLAGLLPQNGLIVDVRDNGGGLIFAGEQLLQILTPRSIEPERLQFINTPVTLRLCELHAPSPVGVDLTPWLESVRRAVETGAAFSASFPITPPEKCNAIGQRYYGPVVLITNARCYSTTDIFSAGFQDHDVGPILGVDGNTGAGGANVWQHGLLTLLFSDPGPPAKPLPDSPLKPLPKGANMRVAIRRTLRVGPQAGTELEDLGVTPSHRHEMTKADVLNGNVDLLNRAAGLLKAMPVFALSVTHTVAGGKISLDVTFKNMDRLDFYLGGRPQTSKNVSPAAASLALVLDVAGGPLVVQGFKQGKLVACRRVDI